MLRGRQHAAGFALRTVLGPQRPGDARPVVHAEEFVDLGQLAAQLVGVALREAADHEKALDPARRLGGRGPQDQVDGLLLGVADESAGVDDHHFGVGAVAVGRHFITRGPQLGHQVFAVHRVFRTAEGDDVNFFIAEQCLYELLRSNIFNWSIPSPTPM